jgi:hypothetical protein
LGTVFGGVGVRACPFLGHSFFPIKWIADFRGCRCDKAWFLLIVRLGPRFAVAVIKIFP